LGKNYRKRKKTTKKPGVKNIKRIKERFIRKGRGQKGN